MTLLDLTGPLRIEQAQRIMPHLHRDEQLAATDASFVLTDCAGGFYPENWHPEHPVADIRAARRFTNLNLAMHFGFFWQPYINRPVFIRVVLLEEGNQ